MEVTLAEMMEADQTAGRLVGAASRPEVVFRAVHLVMAVAAPVPTDRVAEGHTMVEMGMTEDPVLAAVVVLEAEGAQVAPEAQVDQAVREEEEAPLMRVMTVDGEVAASTPTSQRS